jgi:hypothetical protein
MSEPLPDKDDQTPILFCLAFCCACLLAVAGVGYGLLMVNAEVMILRAKMRQVLKDSITAKEIMREQGIWKEQDYDD